jgi:hypothetical protein
MKACNPPGNIGLRDPFVTAERSAPILSISLREMHSMMFLPQKKRS